MSHELRRLVLALSCVSIGLLGGSLLAQTRTNPDAQLMADFQERVKKYMELHEKLEKESPKLEETKDPAKIQASQETLGRKITEARKGARQGEIFSPEIQKLFRRLLSPEVKGADAQEVKESIKEDAPKGVPIRINAKYPDHAPLPTVPPNLLAALPKLPEDLEYRFINRDLILRDVHANIIVDFIRNAIR